jgi:hypothetical protein
VNVVAIGAMATEMWGTVPDEIKEKFYENIPMHRACTTEEAARSALLGRRGRLHHRSRPEHERRHLPGLTQADVPDLPYSPRSALCPIAKTAGVYHAGNRRADRPDLLALLRLHDDTSIFTLA